MKSLTLLAALLLFGTCPAKATLPLTVENPRTEYIKNPVGIDQAPPRLDWELKSTQRGCLQTAYQIQAASTAEKLAAGDCDLWDSGKVVSDNSIQVAYAGKPLASGARAYWRVRAWDNQKQVSDYSAPAFFEIGLLKKEDWQPGYWIGASELPLLKTDPGSPFQPTHGENADEPVNPAILLRREFTLPGKIKSARAYICGLGYFELTINGKRVGDHVLDPGHTDFDHRVLYVTHDVTSDLKEGANALSVVLGGGWYDMPTPEEEERQKAPWRRSPRALIQVNVTMADGTTQMISSDEKWRVTTAGPVVFNSVRGGEIYDARKELKGWDQPGFKDEKWKSALVVEAPKGTLIAQYAPPIKVMNTVEPVKITTPRPGVYVFDMGQNMAGWVQLKIRGEAGTTVKLKYGERLTSEGLVTQNGLNRFTFGRYQTDTYILKGGEEEIWEPGFGYHGFRYVEVTGLMTPPTLDLLRGRVVYSSVEPGGSFSCSNELINRVQEACRSTLVSNIHSIPTDCPTREKAGWMADALVAATAAVYNFDMVNFYRKWLDDMRDAQVPNHGGMPAFVPFSGWRNVADSGGGGMWSDPTWGGACVVLPWILYQQTGDVGILEKYYPMMKAYTESLDRRSKDHLIDWKSGGGDWLEVGTANWPKRTPKPLTSTAFFYDTARIVAQAAMVLGNKEDAQAFTTLAQEIKDAFNKAFYDEKLGGYGADSQTANAFPLAVGLVPSEKENQVLASLVKNIIETRKSHISSGIVGTRFVMDVLSERGRSDVAYTMAAQKDYPGWGYMLADGNTTITEEWNRVDSLNHPALTTVSGWFYRSLAGINVDPAAPGYKNILIKPAVVGDLTHAKGSIQTVHGQVTSEWEKNEKGLKFHVVVPANSTAQLTLPATEKTEITESGQPVKSAKAVTLVRRESGQAVYTLGSGDYVFELRNEK